MGRSRLKLPHGCCRIRQIEFWITILLLPQFQAEIFCCFVWSNLGSFYSDQNLERCTLNTKKISCITNYMIIYYCVKKYIISKIKVNLICFHSVTFLVRLDMFLPWLLQTHRGSLRAWCVSWCCREAIECNNHWHNFEPDEELNEASALVQPLRFRAYLQRISHLVFQPYVRKVISKQPLPTFLFLK